MHTTTSLLNSLDSLATPKNSPRHCSSINSFPIAFKYGDFDYGADDLREMNVTWKYDYATANVDGVDQDFGHSSS